MGKQELESMRKINKRKWHKEGQVKRILFSSEHFQEWNVTQAGFGAISRREYVFIIYFSILYLAF